MVVFDMWPAVVDEPVPRRRTRWPAVHAVGDPNGTVCPKRGGAAPENHRVVPGTALRLAPRALGQCGAHERAVCGING